MIRLKAQIFDFDNPLLQAILDARVRELAPYFRRPGEDDRGFRIRINPASLAETPDEKVLAKVLFKD